jgi:hypothetical protein
MTRPSEPSWPEEPPIDESEAELARSLAEALEADEHAPSGEALAALLEAATLLRERQDLELSQERQGELEREFARQLGSARPRARGGSLRWLYVLPLPLAAAAAIAFVVGRVEKRAPWEASRSREALVWPAPPAELVQAQAELLAVESVGAGAERPAGQEVAQARLVFDRRMADYRGRWLAALENGGQR